MIGLNRPHPKSTRGSRKALIVEVKGHPQIPQVQVHPGGGRHEGACYKVSTTTEETIKIVGPSTYEPNPGEKAKVISGGWFDVVKTKVDNSSFGYLSI